MGTSLNGLTPSATYTGLLKFGDNSAISASLKAISDGAGNDTILELSTAALQIGGSTGAFWDNTNKRLGIGTNAPSATAHFKGSGSTSATTSLLVQNSAGNSALQVQDNLNTTLFGTLQFGNGNTYINNQSSSIVFAAVNSATADLHMIPGRQMNINNTGTYTAQASALLQVDSTTKGFLPPRMATTQKNAIASPAAGLIVYDSTLGKLCVRTASAWETITSV